MKAKLQDRKILLGVSGGIAAYKACTLCRLLVKLGACVHVIMTPAATKLVGPATFEALSGHPVGIDVFSEASNISHVNLAADADLMVIAPATANTIAKLSSGLADNLLSATFLAATCPVLVAPAMNVNMYRNLATQANLKTLKERGVYVIKPGVGDLACGVSAEGRLPEPEEICNIICSILADRLAFNQDPLLPKPKAPLELTQTRLLPAADGAGLRVLITAGPTIEDLDPVRFISNRSSGKMGYALAQACRSAGAYVTLVTGPVNIEPPEGVTVVKVRSASQMLTAVDKLVSEHQIFIGAAAVADYRAENIATDKIKKQEGVDGLNLKLVKNPDIIATVAKRESGRPFTVGFAAETSNLEQNAQSKIVRKNLDMIVLNNVASNTIGFDSNDNEVTVFDRDGKLAHFEKEPKSVIAKRLVSLILKAYKASSAED
jgi:phosphopantothenoylcysteine decarboxylase/phosphopantothenate--cysteine ligase